MFGFVSRTKSISQRMQSLVQLTGLVVVALVTWRMGKRKGAATAWKLVR